MSDTPSTTQAASSAPATQSVQQPLSVEQLVRQRLGRTAQGQALMKVLDDNHAKLTRKQAFGTIPTVEPPANPARAMVSGDVQTIAEAAAMVDGYKDVPQTLKDFLKEEIAELTTNAVQLDVHVLDLANGDVSVHIQIKGIQLGPKKVVQS